MPTNGGLESASSSSNTNLLIKQEESTGNNTNNNNQQQEEDLLQKQIKELEEESKLENIYTIQPIRKGKSKKELQKIELQLAKSFGYESDLTFSEESILQKAAASVNMLKKLSFNEFIQEIKRREQFIKSSQRKSNNNNTSKRKRKAFLPIQSPAKTIENTTPIQQ
ncbi:hypothetical protein ABK040_012952 [Willaertia magna]